MKTLEKKALERPEIYCTDNEISQFSEIFMVKSIHLIGINMYIRACGYTNLSM